MYPTNVTYCACIYTERRPQIVPVLLFINSINLDIYIRIWHDCYGNIDNPYYKKLYTNGLNSLEILKEYKETKNDAVLCRSNNVCGIANSGQRITA